jgi:hypothetical protein
MEGYNNEGFLYINHTATETFKKGEILDSDGNLICLGEIEPLIASPLDENYQDYMRDLIYWTPLLRGIKIRIYWYAEAGEFNISTAGKIYPKNSILFMHPLKLNEQINFDELDQTMCYYAIIERTTKKVILTHIIKNSKETKELTLDNILRVEKDTAFQHHLPLRVLPNESITEQEIIIEKNKQENGFLIIQKDGRSIQFFNNHYSNVYMLEKPDYIDYVEYYIYALNKYPNVNETNFEHYFEYELHYDINNEILVYFPEYREYFDFYKNKLKKYIEKSVESGLADSEARDRDTIVKIVNEESLYLDIESEKKESDYIDVYELIKNAPINPLFADNELNENDTVDMKKIKFTRNLVEAQHLQELIQLIG